MWSISRCRSTSQPSITHTGRALHRRRERRGDRPTEVHHPRDVGALDHQRLDDRVRRQPVGGADRTGPAPSISQISPGAVYPRSSAPLGHVEVQRRQRPRPTLDAPARALPSAARARPSRRTRPRPHARRARRVRLSSKIARSNGSSAAITAAVRSSGPVIVISPGRRPGSRAAASAAGTRARRSPAPAPATTPPRPPGRIRPAVPSRPRPTPPRPVARPLAIGRRLRSRPALPAPPRAARPAPRTSTTGCSSTRVAAVVTDRAAPTVVPDTDANQASTSRNESSPGPTPDATRRPVASSFPAAASRSSSAKSSTSSRAAPPDIASTSSAATSARASRTNDFITRSTSLS